MKGDGGETDSYWPATDIPNDGPLEEDVRTNTCIIGAGVVGLCTAYELMRAGHNVVVLDDGGVGGGESCRSMGQVSSAMNGRFTDLLESHGARDARAAVLALQDGVRWFESVIQREDMAVGWRRVPGLLVGPKADVEAEVAAARSAGVEASLQGSPLARFEAAAAFPDQARIDPVAFLTRLAEILRGGGVGIYTRTHAVRLEDGGRVVVTSSGRTVRCHHVIEATNAPVFGHQDVFGKQQARRTYLIAGEPRNALPDALYWDTSQPQNRIRLCDDGTILVAGRSHETGHPDAGTFAELQEWAHDHVGLGGVSHRWSTQELRPLDGLPLIGRSEGSLIVTGHDGSDWAYAAVAAVVLRDLVTGHQNPLQDLFDPYRRRLSVMAALMREGSQTLASMQRLLMPGQVRDYDEIRPGEAAIVRRGLRLFACYRDADGTLHRQLAVCKHMGGIVAWNPTEKTWDCPAHGSRYTGEGTVVNGPANEDLRDTEAHGDGVTARPARRPPGERAPETEQDGGHVQSPGRGR